MEKLLFSKAGVALVNKICRPPWAWSPWPPPAGPAEECREWRGAGGSCAGPSASHSASTWSSSSESESGSPSGGRGLCAGAGLHLAPGAALSRASAWLWPPGSLPLRLPQRALLQGRAGLQLLLPVPMPAEGGLGGAGTAAAASWIPEPLLLGRRWQERAGYRFLALCLAWKKYLAYRMKSLPPR